MAEAPAGGDGQPLGGRPHGLDEGGEQQRPPHRRHLGAEVLLDGLLAEGGEVGRGGDAGEDLDVGVAQPPDELAVVVAVALVAAGVDDLVAAFFSTGGKPRSALLQAWPSGSFGHRAPTRLLVGTAPHMSVNTAMTSSRPQ
jgi:hypothetical protein